VYEPDEDRDQGAGPDDRPTVDWDAWERDRLNNPRIRWMLILMLVSAVSMIALYIQSGGDMIPWGPPGK
jgi:hypothetical protein